MENRRLPAEPEEKFLPLVLRGLLLVPATALVLAAFWSSTPAPGELLVPVRGISSKELADGFDDLRDGGQRLHAAMDIHAPWGTPVVATTDGIVHRLLESPRGGLGIYHLDAERRRCYYYGHLARYRKGLQEGTSILRGEVLGFVGATGNASEDAPHLHFAAYEVGGNGRCATGTPLNPYPLLLAGSPAPGLD